MKAFYWQLKREFWEHRGGLLWTPLIVAGVFLALNMVGLISVEWLHQGSIQINGVHLNAMSKQDSVTASPYIDILWYLAIGAPALLLSIVMGIVVFVYSLGTLYNDRRDRSILFWKSLPLSDTSTVLAKLVTALITAPVISLAVGAVSGVMMVFLAAMVMSFEGLPTWHLLSTSHPFQAVFYLLALLPVYSLWALPTVGWLLMCSAFSRSRPFVLAVVAPIGITLMLGWFKLIHVINIPFAGICKTLLLRLLTGVFPGGWVTREQLLKAHRIPGDLNLPLPPKPFDLGLHYAAFGRMDLWLGVLAGAIFVAIAIWCRRWRDEA